MFGFLKKRPEPIAQSNIHKFEKILNNKIPEVAVSYILELWQAHPFSFTVARSRKTCLGNYIFKNNHHFISVNGDSNPYSFLITLVHEIAHQRVTIAASKFRKKPLPHGTEWKTTFSSLMQPLLNGKVFPEAIEKVLKKHMINPAASSTKDPELMRVLGFDLGKHNEGTYLSEINEGEKFVFGNRGFKKISDRRTRTLVECLQTRKRYTIPSHAVIQNLDE